MRWTHITVTSNDLEGSTRFFADVCKLHVLRDRRTEGGNTVWMGYPSSSATNPEFVVVIGPGDCTNPLDHFGFQCETRDEVTRIAELARANGTLVEGPKDVGGSVGYFVIVREPGGNLVEFTFGQPLIGLGANGGSTPR